MSFSRRHRRAATLATVSACVLMGAAVVIAAPTPVVLQEGGFSPEDLRWDRDEAGAVLPVLPGTSARLFETGDPDLPAHDLVFLVGLDQGVARLEVEAIATRVVALTDELSLAAPLKSDTGETVVQDLMAATDRSFPATWGSYLGAQTWRGYRLVSVRVHPLRALRDADGDYTAVEILERYRIRLVPGDAPTADVVQRQRRVAGEKESNIAALRDVIANPEALVSYQRQEGQDLPEPRGFVPTRTPSLSGSSVNYLIITNEALAGEFQRLADYRTANGRPAVVATTEYIESNFRNGSDVQETVRMFIRDAYEKWGIEYVLLGGDTDVLPPRFIRSKFYPYNGHTDVPADLYFQCLDGNWNGDADAFYGEPYEDAEDPGDEADFAEEIYVGRAPVNNVAQTVVFIDKIIEFEAATPEDLWTNRMLFLAEVLFPENWPDSPFITLDGAEYPEETISDFIIPCTDMEYTKMYQNYTEYPGSVPLNLSAVIDSLNTGHYSLCNQVGHGYFYNMSVGDANFLTTDADNLTNENYFMIYALNCASAAFDVSCLMERFIQNPNGGSVASIGSARAAFPNNSNGYQQEFWRLLFCEDAREVGRAVALSRLPFIGSTPFNYVDRWTFLNYVLLGDPALNLWKNVPEAPSITAPSDINPGEQNVAVIVNADGAPVENARVSLSKEGDDYAVGTTSVAGFVALPFTPTSSGSATLTVSGEGLEVTAMSIGVQSVPTYIALDEMEILDDGTYGSQGNGNGVPEAGENVALNLTVRDTGGGGATGCSALLATGTVGISILDGTATIGTVPAGGMATVEGAFLLGLDATVTDGSAGSFVMLVDDDQQNAYHSEWTQIVSGPELEPVALVWSDAIYGNDDGVLDDNERVTVTIRLKNFGAGIADQVTAVLRSDDPAVTLYDSTGTYTGVGLLDESDGVTNFSLAQDSGAAASTSRVVFTDNYGRQFVHNFSLQRPDPPNLFETDTSFGTGVIVLRWAPPAEGVRGYHVYRSESETGPFTRVNTDIVDGVAYFRDVGLSELTVYYYRISTLGVNLVESDVSVIITQATAPAEVDNFPISFLVESSAHPAVGDVDGDHRHEIVLASDEIHVFNDDGTEQFDGDGDSQTLGPITDAGYLFEPAGVTLANLDDDPALEIIASLNNHRASPPVNEIHIYNAEDGSQLDGWPQILRDVANGWNWGAPAVGDIDGDEDLEIVVNTLDGRTWAWHHDGTEVRDGDNNAGTNGVFVRRVGEGWNYTTPALYDIDGVPGREIITGTKYWEGGQEIMVYKADGSQVDGFPYSTAESGHLIYSPAVADLNGDGIVEIVISGVEGKLYVVQEDGTDYPGFPIQHDFAGLVDPGPSPALADLDQDGELEIVWITQLEAAHGLRSDILVIDTNIGSTSGQIMNGWPVILPASSEGSPVIGDITGDGIPEILHGVGGQNENAPDNLYALYTDGSSVDGFPISLEGPFRASPVLCDLDFDGDTDIVAQAWDRKVHVWDMPAAYDREYVPWPTFHGNNQRDGTFFSLDLVDAPEQVPTAFTVDAPYPNPFNPITKVRLYVPGQTVGDGQLDLGVYNLQGRRIRTVHQGAIAPGWHTFTWDGRDDGGRGQASGLYFMRAKTGQRAVVHKLTLVK